MKSQIVYRLTARNSFRDIKQFEEPMPTINLHEVLVRIKAVALNYRDLAISDGSYLLPVKDQVVPCSDGAGEVVETGTAVSGVRKGDHVIGSFNLTQLYGPQRDSDHAQGGTVDGVLRQYVALPEQAITVIPKSAGLSFPQMASLVCAGVTSWNALYGNTPLKPGQIVLFQGAYPSQMKY
jgi:NADPH:quinone reductase-like Zn-dependent oxidoreductase